MSDASLRATINCTIEILLEKEPIQTRLSRVDRYITELEQHRSELPDGCWEALENAVAVLVSPKNALPAFATLSWSPASSRRATKPAGSSQSNEFHCHGLPQLVSDQRFSFGADLPDEAAA